MTKLCMFLLPVNEVSWEERWTDPLADLTSHHYLVDSGEEKHCNASIMEINVPQSIICGDYVDTPPLWNVSMSLLFCIAGGLLHRFSDYNMPLNCLEMRNSFPSYNWIRGTVFLNSISALPLLPHLLSSYPQFISESSPPQHFDDGTFQGSFWRR